jgi:hypothetical protein
MGSAGQRASKLENRLAHLLRDGMDSARVCREILSLQVRVHQVSRRGNHMVRRGSSGMEKRVDTALGSAWNWDRTGRKRLDRSSTGRNPCNRRLGSAISRAGQAQWVDIGLGSARNRDRTRRNRFDRSSVGCNLCNRRLGFDSCSGPWVVTFSDDCRFLRWHV